MNKTLHYIVVFQDGTIQHRITGGRVSDLRKYLENNGYKISAIFPKINPLYYNKDFYDQKEKYYD